MLRVMKYMCEECGLIMSSNFNLAVIFVRPVQLGLILNDDEREFWFSTSLYRVLIIW